MDTLFLMGAVKYMSWGPLSPQEVIITLQMNGGGLFSILGP